MNQFRSFCVVFVSPTNHKGARVSIYDTHYGERRILPYDYRIGNITLQAQEFLNNHGLHCVACSEINGKTHIHVNSFEQHIAVQKDDKVYAVTNYGTFETQTETK